MNGSCRANLALCVSLTVLSAACSLRAQTGDVAAAAAGAGSGVAAASPAGTGRHPLVVMKQAEIKGRVFYLSEETTEESIAVGQSVQVWSPDGKSMIQETKTDDAGWCTLKDLGVGAYRLNVGKLALELRVETPGSGTDPKKVPRKTILVFIPRDLAKG